MTSQNNHHYRNTIVSAELLKTIYHDKENQDFLFDTLDAICKQEQENSTFWKDLFYYSKDEFKTKKTRLFFTHKDTNLLKRCLFYFADFRGFTFPEQILLLACLTYLKAPSETFNDQIRVIRNLVVNSENELRDSVLGKSFSEVEQFILNNDLHIFKTFKTYLIRYEEFYTKVEKSENQMVYMYTFIVTNMDSSPEYRIKFYCKRGMMENFIKESKSDFDFASVSSL